MGLFDFFTKEAEPEKKAKSSRPVGFSSQKKQHGSNPDNDNVQVKVFYPKSFDDVCEIIDFLLLNKPVVVNMETIKDETIQRVMDILSGACYALRGNISEISKNIYLISLDNQGL